MNIGFPDVCPTPVGPAVVPIPYPNLAMNVQATPFSEVVKVSMMNALNTLSQIPMTTGDEAGTAGPIKGPGRYTMGNPIVYVDLMPAIHLTCPTTGNNMNNALGAVLVPSATNVFYCLCAEADALRPSGPVVSGELLPGAVGCLRASLFTMDLPSLIHREVQALLGGGMAALILDLRGNPGGDLDAFLRLADDFLDARQGADPHDGPRRGRDRLSIQAGRSLSFSPGPARGPRDRLGRRALCRLPAMPRPRGRRGRDDVWQGAGPALPPRPVRDRRQLRVPRRAPVHGAGVSPDVLIPGEDALAPR